MENKYGYLKPYCHYPNFNDDQPMEVLHAPFNIFGPIYADELEKAEHILQQAFPHQLRQFYIEIGSGHLMKVHNALNNEGCRDGNEILPPLVVANFATGKLRWEGQEYHWMDESTYELMEQGDLPFFEIGDSSSFLFMKLNSDNPNAVWDYDLKITDSFEEFVWRLYYESPDFYGQIITDYLESKKK